MGYTPTLPEPRPVRPRYKGHERNAAGLRPYLSGCTDCAELEEAWRAAPDGERRRAGVEARAHWIVAHAAVGEDA